MKKPKLLKMWGVARNTDTSQKNIFYGSFAEFLEYEGEGGHWTEIPFENWLSDDMAEIFGNELENANYHSWTWLPAELNRSMKENKIPEKECFSVLLDMYTCWVYA